MPGNFDGGYDAGYRSVTAFWGTSPGTLVSEFLRDIDASHLTVLDAGAGEGKNAAAFARHGAKVDAIECSHAAIENGRRLYPGVEINWIEEDVRHVPLPSEHYDAVVCYGLIHCLRTEQEAANVMDALRRSLKVGGSLMLAAFNDGSHDLSAHPGFEPLLLPHYWFVAQFAGWDVKTATDTLLYETHPNNNIPHHHSMSRIRAVKT